MIRITYNEENHNHTTYLCKCHHEVAIGRRRKHVIKLQTDRLTLIIRKEKQSTKSRIKEKKKRRPKDDYVDNTTTTNYTIYYYYSIEVN